MARLFARSPGSRRGLGPPRLLSMRLFSTIWASVAPVVAKLVAAAPLLVVAPAYGAEPAPVPPPDAVTQPAAPVDSTSPAKRNEAPPSPETLEAAAASPPPAEPALSDSPEAALPPPIVATEPEAAAEASSPDSLEPEAALALASDEQARAKPSTPFDRNSVRVGLVVGWAQADTTDWLVLGGGLGYYVLDGLEVHADANFWVGGSPFIATVTPGVRYVFHMLPDVKPYVGTFYRHYFVDRPGFDSDSLGGRAGIYFMVNSHAYIGGGLVVEQLINNNLFENATQVYPEVTFALAF